MTGFDTASGVPAAWYPDPQGPPLLRWWDGAVWTSHTMHPEPASAAVQAPVPAEVPVVPIQLQPVVAEPVRPYVPMSGLVMQMAQASGHGPAVERGSTQTPAVWMLALYPLVQLVILLVITFVVESFGGTTSRFAVGGSSIVFSLYCGFADSKALKERGYRPPGWGWALLPLVYFILRAVRVGRGSLGPLFAWIGVQVALAAIVIATLLPAFLSLGGGGLTADERAYLLTPAGMSQSVAADLTANKYDVTSVDCVPLDAAQITQVNCTAMTPTSTLYVVLQITPGDPDNAYTIVSGTEYAH